VVTSPKRTWMAALQEPRPPKHTHIQNGPAHKPVSICRIQKYTQISKHPVERGPIGELRCFYCFPTQEDHDCLLTSNCTPRIALLSRAPQLHPPPVSRRRRVRTGAEPGRLVPCFS